MNEIEQIAENWIQENAERDLSIREIIMEGIQLGMDHTKKKPGFKAADMPIPQWLPRGAWQEWCADRAQRKKAITKRAAVLQIAALSEYMNQGHRPEDVIRHSIASGYQGLFPPKASASDEPAWRREQRQRTQLAAPGVAVGSMPAAEFFEAETRRLQ